MAGTSGVRARITKKGIDYANAQIHKDLSNELNSLQIPDFDGDGRHYEWHVRSVKASDSGSVDVEVNGGTVQIVIRLGIDDNGRPSVSLASCNVHINNTDVKFHGGAAFIYNLFSDVCGKRVGEALKNQVYKAMEKLVNKDGTRKLAALKVSVPLSKRFTLDYSLTQTPSVQANQLETELKGKVYWTGDSYEAPISPNPIAPFDDDSKMLYFWLSDYTANTLMLVGQKNNFFEYNLTSEKLPETHRYFLSTSSHQMCIGKLIPQVGTMYPNSQVEAKIVTSSAPIVKITPETVMVDVTSSINLIAHTSEHKAPFLLNFNMDISLSVAPSIVGEKVTCKIVDHRIKVEIVRSAVGQLNDTVLNPILTMLMSFFVIPQIQKILDKGVDLPVSDAVKFENAEIKLLDGSLLIATDVQVL